MKSRLLSVAPLVFLLLTLQVYADDGEQIPSGEAEDIAKLSQFIATGVATKATHNGHAFRDAHRKHHGCVRASFAVMDKIPTRLAQGLFATPQSYRAWIRFSNGSGDSQKDGVGDGRGMAVKILGVPGAKMLGDGNETATQDFVMINHPVFFIRNVNDYVGFQEATDAGLFSTLWWFARHISHEGRIAWAIKQKKITNPLDTRYWSMTPSKLGDEQIKFSAKPCRTSQLTEHTVGDGFLAENMQHDLAESNACFEFLVQLRNQPADMPIEDPTIEWDERVAPFIPIAQIEIPRQKPETSEFCETLAFSPWHTLPEHRPLGGISRARREIYRAVSRMRHVMNNQPELEPK